MIPIIGSAFPTILIPLIDGAKKNIDICMYDWRWHPNLPGNPIQRINIALVNARKRGVQIRAVTHTDLLTEQLNKVGIAARVLADRRTLHAKLILIDGQTLVIGSHNLTHNACSSNIEASVVVPIPEGQTRWQEFFNNLYGL